MEEDGAPTLEVGFAINFGDAFGQLRSLDDIIGEASANAVREFNRIEAAAGGLNFGGATASVKTFGSETTRAGQDAKQAFAQAEKAGESLSRQLERQISTFGMSREQIRAMKVETAALTAEQQGLSELAGRLRAQQEQLAGAEAAAAQRAREEAEAVRQAGEAYRTFNAYAAQKMTAYREQQAAESAQAASADQLRARIDPLYTAQKRYDEEVRVAGALLNAKKISEAEHAAAVTLSGKALNEAKRALEGHTSATGLNRIQVITAQSAFMRFADSVMAGRSPLTAFALEAHKGVEVLSEDDGGMAGGLAKVTALLTPMNLALAAAAAVTIAAGAAWFSYDEAMNRLATTAQGTGALLGETAAQLEANAEAASAASTLTIGAARDLAAGYASVARSGEVLTDLTAITKDFAAATNQDMKSAAKNLATAFSDPAAGAEELAAKYGMLTQAQAEQITKLQEAGEYEKAQKQFLADLAPVVDGAAEHLTGMALAWEHIKQAASQASNAVGEFMSKHGQSVISSTLAAFGGSGTEADWLFTPQKQGPLKNRPAGDARANATAAAAMSIANRDTGYAQQLQHQQQLAQVNTALANTTGLAADQVARLRYEQDALTHAVDTWRPKAQQANDIIAANTKLRQATTPQARAAARALQEQAKAEGQVVSAQEVAARVQDRAEGYHNRANVSGQRHIDMLAREAAAQEAQIKNLYLVADAYGVSGAAALVAEAREKAESAAIKQRGDVDEAVNRQVRLAIAQRVADSERSVASMRDQAAVQEDVNAGVEKGLVPAARAAEMVRDRLADLPLLAAIEVAQQRGLKTEADKATKALEDQRAARLRLSDAENEARLDAAVAAGKDQVALLQEELRLIGATDAARVHSLATMKAEQEARNFNYTGAKGLDYVKTQVAVADGQQQLKEAQDAWNASLSLTADKWDLIAQTVQAAGQGMQDAFGSAGKALGDLGAIYANYHATQARLDQQRQAVIDKYGATSKQAEIENQKYALSTATSQIGAWGDAAEAAKGFFTTGSAGYEALQKAEQVFRAVQFALSIRAMAQDAIETGSSIAKSAARTAAHAVEAVVKAISSLPFPLNLAAGAATAAAIAALGVSIAGGFGGSGSKPAPSNAGTGTILGDSTAKSDSLKNAIDALKDVDTTTSVYAREMAASLKSIDDQIGSFSALIARTDNINASAGVNTGFKTDTLGSILSAPASLLSHIPVIGGIFGAISSVISSLFGTKTQVTGSGLYGGAQSVGSINAGGFALKNYSDIEKTHKFLGITTGHSYSTQYAAADPTLQSQFTLILKSFDEAIAASAGPLGEATDAVQARLNSFVLNIGKIDLTGLTGDQIKEKLENILSAAADSMAGAAFPGIEKFQQVGEGAFQTLVRVASTVEAVTGSLDELGLSARAAGIDAKMGLASQFDSLSDMASATDAYFKAFYTPAEQTAAEAAKLGAVFTSLGVIMPTTLDAFRQLVDAQDLTTAAGQATYAALIKLAPAFADLQSSLQGAKSAADVASERDDLQRQLLELQGNTAAIRALDLAKVDASNRALQEQVWAVQDAQDAAKAAQDLADSWKTVGDSIMDEVKRIRGLTDPSGDGSFASLMGQFNAATLAARSGDQDAAKSLPQLSQALLTAAANAATSRQELDRVQAQTAASLEQTYGVITALTKPAAASSADTLTSAAAASQATSATPAPANDDLATEVGTLHDEIANLRSDMNAALATVAANTGRTARILDAVTSPSGGDAVSVAA